MDAKELEDAIMRDIGNGIVDNLREHGTNADFLAAIAPHVEEAHVQKEAIKNVLKRLAVVFPQASEVLGRLNRGTLQKGIAAAGEKYSQGVN